MAPRYQSYTFSSIFLPETLPDSANAQIHSSSEPNDVNFIMRRGEIRMIIMYIRISILTSLGDGRVTLEPDARSLSGTETLQPGSTDGLSDSSS